MAVTFSFGTGLERGDIAEDTGFLDGKLDKESTGLVVACCFDHGDFKKSKRVAVASLLNNELNWGYIDERMVGLDGELVKKIT